MLCVLTDRAAAAAATATAAESTGCQMFRKAPSVNQQALHLCSPRVCSVSKWYESQEIVLSAAWRLLGTFSLLFPF